MHRPARTLIALAATSLVLSGCFGDDAAADSADGSGGSGYSDSSESAEEWDDRFDAPGSVIEQGEWFTYRSEDNGGDEVVMRFRVTGMEQATPDYVEDLERNGSGSGYDFFLVRGEEEQVDPGGATGAFSWGHWRNPDQESQRATIIGDTSPDGCRYETQVLQGIVDQCLLLRVDPGVVPEGLWFVSGEQDPDELFDPRDGNPVLLKAHLG
ncbi:hypothetical protein RDV89_10905 [Nocardioides zeae]|uniref:Lipoprotein n=1 Tax=Nocardioides imazamoxiresistens TaxID=3231893 RepID=A0ABU3PWG4_9ACTN|nr:hypothetical protein [Nocardioides zeae]MDT9593578.1 hypothetical protein [Nocardioides zeae]